jgi:hypothetical protein
MDVLERMRNAADARGEMAKMTFASRIESQFNESEIYAYLQESGLYWRERLASKVEFECARSNPRIQVADLFAREAMKNLDNDLGPVKRATRRSWECLTASGHFHVQNYGEEYFRDLGEKRDTLERVLGIGIEEYGRWLDGARVPACFTSYLRFLRQKRKEMSEDRLKQFSDIFGDL